MNDLNFARFDAKLEQRLAEVKAELLAALAAQRSEMVIWMFVFWIGNVATTAGLVFALAHFLRS